MGRVAWLPGTTLNGMPNVVPKSGWSTVLVALPMSFCVHVASMAAFGGIGWFQASLAGKIPHPPTEGDVCAPPSLGGTLASGKFLGASVAARASVIAPPPAVPPLPAVLFPVPPALFEPPLFEPPAL